MTTAPPAGPPTPVRRRASAGVLTAVVVLVVVALVVVAGLLGLRGGQTDRSTPPDPATPTRTSAPTPAPTSTLDVPLRAATLDAGSPGTTPPAPVRVVLADRAIDVPVDPVGVAPDGQMEIPPLAERAGWYRFGAHPGDTTGTAVVAAHVDSVASAGLGPFARLGDVAVGDVAEVTLADGAVVRYAVTDVVRVPKPEAVWADVFTRDGPPRLVLVTCGGTFQPDARRYSDNVIVTAEPVGA